MKTPIPIGLALETAEEEGVLLLQQKQKQFAMGNNRYNSPSREDKNDEEASVIIPETAHQVSNGLFSHFPFMNPTPI